MRKNTKRDTVDEVRNNLLVYLMRVVRIVEGNTYTANHSDRVAGYAEIIAKKMGFAGRELSTVWRGGLLHDVGKIGVSHSIIMARRSLKPKEIVAVRKHSEYGYNILKGSYLSMEATIARQHHEYFDGTGYPDGLKGKDIHIFARIICVADVFDSLIDNRPYRKAWDIQKAADYIRSMSGKMFDPDIVRVFFELAGEGAFSNMDKIKGFSVENLGVSIW